MKMAVLALGSSGPSVTALQQRLQQRGFDPGGINGQFGPATQAAVQAFQRSVGLSADGQAGPNTIAALSMPSITHNFTLDIVAQMFPATPRLNIQFHLPFVLKALLDATLADKSMVLMALGTIRAETASFLPIEEFESRFNTTPGGPHPFDIYDHMTQLGNLGPPDGANFKGRGFVQLTGRANYTQFSKVIGLGDQLVQNPDLASDPDIASKILAAFLRAKENQIRQALQNNELAAARRLVNGGTNGLPDFTDAIERGRGLIPDPVQMSAA
jgi:peptidoglycan L-alanyl-D-glutamate endopeptidase CwlK